MKFLVFTALVAVVAVAAALPADVPAIPAVGGSTGNNTACSSSVVTQLIEAVDELLKIFDSEKHINDIYSIL